MQAQKKAATNQRVPNKYDLSLLNMEGRKQDAIVPLAPFLLAGDTNSG